jgi:hypothetical protein
MARVTSPILTCIDTSKGNFKFDVKFDEMTARVWVQGDVFNLKYERLLDRQDGKLFWVYGNQQFTVTTSLPKDKFVFMQTKERSPRLMASAHCN